MTMTSSDSLIVDSGIALSVICAFGICTLPKISTVFGVILTVILGSISPRASCVLTNCKFEPIIFISPFNWRISLKERYPEIFALPAPELKEPLIMALFASFA